MRARPWWNSAAHPSKSPTPLILSLKRRTGAPSGRLTRCFQSRLRAQNSAGHVRAATRRAGRDASRPADLPRCLHPASREAAGEEHACSEPFRRGASPTPTRNPALFSHRHGGAPVGLPDRRVRYAESPPLPPSRSAALSARDRNPSISPSLRLLPTAAARARSAGSESEPPRPAKTCPNYACCHPQVFGYFLKSRSHRAPVFKVSAGCRFQRTPR